MTEDEQRSRHQPVEENMAMQQRVWRFERVGWYVLSLVMLLALAGLFGRGPLSQGQASSADGRAGAIRALEPQRRDGTPEDHGTWPAQRAGRGPAGWELFREASLETLQPQPLRSRSEGQGLALQLETGTDGTATLYLTLRADTPGSLEGRVSLGPDSVVHFSSFIYP